MARSKKRTRKRSISRQRVRQYVPKTRIVLSDPFARQNDLRLWKPYREEPLKTDYGRTVEQVAETFTKEGRYKPLGISGIRVENPERLRLCRQRRVRRRELFRRKKIGRGKRVARRRRYTQNSKVRC